MISQFNKSHRDIVITGDFNIDLLHVNNANKKNYGEFLEFMLGYSLISTITLPSRIGDNGSCTLIDNLFRKLTAKSTVFPNWHTAHQTLRSLSVLHELAFTQQFRESKGKQQKRLWFTKLKYRV